ncbi:MAG: hypothetical protein EBZ78_02605 [Verrucomicrobia bacterium]|nr:hypothetical protein [Verrucomicrobiota bacterium]
MDAVATAKLALEKSSFENGLKEAENAVNKFAKQTAGILTGAFAFDKILSGLSSAIDKGDQLQDLANRFGISASALQEVGNAASLSGAGVEDVASAMNKLAVNAGKAIGGDDAMIASFEKLGLTVSDLQGMSPQDIFFKLSEAVASANDPLEAFAQAQEVAGKSVGALMETLRMGPDAIQQMGQGMGTWSDDTIAQLAAASDEIKSFQNTMMIAFGSAAQFINPMIKGFKFMAEQIAMAMAMVGEALTGNLAGAKAISDEMKKSKAEFNKGDQPKAAGKPMDLEGGAGGGKKASAKAAKETEKAEKDAIKERTDEAMRALKEEEDEKKMAADSEERRRQYIFESEREAVNEKIKQNEEAAKYQQKYNEWLAGAPDRARQGQQATGQAAGQRLDIAAGLGGGVAAEVEKARKKAAEDQKKITQGQLDKEVLASTSATKVGSFGIGTAQRSMSERRSEYIQTQAKKEAEGKTTLDDINKTLQDALAKLTSAPLVS